MKEQGFAPLLSSGRQYEEICGELYHNGEAVTMISQEQGIEKALIEIFRPNEGDVWKFDYDEFTAELGKLYKRLEEGGLIEQEGRFKLVLAPGGDKVQVFYEMLVVATVALGDSSDKIAIQLHMPPRGGVWKFRYREFMDYLGKAVKLIKS